MIITIPVASQDQFNSVYSLLAGYALVDVRNKTQVTTSDAATLAAALQEDSDDPVCRVRYCNVTQYVEPDLASQIPVGKEIADIRVRLIDDESLLDNEYWYGRDCSTVGYLNVIVVDETKYEATKAKLRDQATKARSGLIPVIEADLATLTDDKIVKAANAMLELLRTPRENVDPLDFWCLSSFDLNTLKVFCDVIMKKSVARQQFQVWQLFHSLCYTPSSPWGVKWALACNYKHPFHGNTRARGDGAFIVDVWKAKPAKKTRAKKGK